MTGSKPRRWSKMAFWSCVSSRGAGSSVRFVPIISARTAGWKLGVVLCACRAALASPGFAAFLDKQPHDRKGTDAIDPPESKQCLRRKAYHGDKRQPPAGDRFDGVGPQRAAAQLFSKVELAAGEIAHDRNGEQRHGQSRPRKFFAQPPPHVPACRNDDISRERKQ